MDDEPGYNENEEDVEVNPHNIIAHRAMDPNSLLLPFEERQLHTVIITKKITGTDINFGKSPSRRKVKELLRKSIFILDKPSGPSSHQSSDYAKKILGLGKSGHSGTLDPMVTGVLPIAFEEGTRITNALINAGKEYVCLMHLHADVSNDKLLQAFDEFSGKISQLPPKRSAVKRQIRERSIYYLEIIERLDRDVLFTVGCQAGTYIRKLVHDIGQKIGCGAHMVELRRTKAGPFREHMASTLQELSDAYFYYQNGDDTRLAKLLHPIEEGVSHMKKIWVHDATIDSLTHGAMLKVPGISKLDSSIERGDMVAVMSLKDELVLTGNALMDSKDIKNYDRGIAVKTIQVLMSTGIYPKYKGQ